MAKKPVRVRPGPRQPAHPKERRIASDKSPLRSGAVRPGSSPRTRWRADEVLYGDEQGFEVARELDALAVVDQEGRRRVLVCQRQRPGSDEGASEEDQRPQQGRKAGARAGHEDGG